MNQIYRFLFAAVLLSVFNSSVFSQSPACANFSGVFISDSLEQNLTQYVVCSGSNIYLKSLNNPVGATYQWKKNGVNISGETTRKLSATSSGIYSLTMTVGSCTATSSGILLQFDESYIPISVSYVITQACTGDSITLQASRKDFTFQWKKDGVNIQGANQYYYKATTNGNYTLSVSQGTCSNTSPFPIALSFTNTVLPVISTNKTIVCEGKTTVLKALKINPAYTLQWLKDGVAISGANKDSLVVSQTGNYRLQTSGGTCNGNSNSLNISITNLNLPAPQIENFLGYSDRFYNFLETCENNVVRLKVKDYNDGDLTWLKDGNVIAGQTGTVLLARESGNYAVRYQGNELCFAQSAVVPVKITNVATMSFAGNDAVVKTGESATIKYTFTGISPIYLKINNTYENLIVNPITQRYFETISATKTFSATTISNACGVGTFSSPTTKTIGNYLQSTSISLNTSYRTVCIGGSTTLSATASGSGSPFTYQWQKDGVDISGATSSSLNLTNFTYSDIGYYRIKAIGTYGSYISDEIQVNANYGDVVFAKLDYPAYTNSDILLTAFSGSSFGNASNAYRWTGPNGFTSTEQNPVITNGTALNSGTYTVTATNAGGCVNYALLSVTVTTAPITLGNLGTTSFCPNGTLSVPFTTTLAIGTLYKVYLSDANGSFRNQTEIGNGMTSPIDITFPQYAQAGTKYRIRIVSTSPSATSSLSGYLSTDGQVLTISVKNLVGKEIETYNTKICDGSALTGIINSNQSGITYEWKKDDVFQTTNASIRMTQSGNYLASVIKTGCSNVSKTLYIDFKTNVYHIANRIGAEYQCAGASIIFRDSYYSDSATYQWKKNNVNLIGETKDTLIANQTGIYKSDITDKCPVLEYTDYDYGGGVGVVFGNTITNTIAAAYSGSTPSVLLCGNNTYGIISSVSAGDKNPLASYSFQWKKNGNNVAYQTGSDTYIVTEVGVYSLALTQGNCTVMSNGVTFTKVDTVRLGLKLNNYSTNEICFGSQVYLSHSSIFGINITGYKDGNVVTNIPGDVSETGRYNISGTAQGCVVIPSDTVKIIVGDKVKPYIYNPRPFVCIGASGYLSTGFNPNNGTYQWFKNNQPIANATYPNLYPTETGFYKLRVSAGSCSGFSDSVSIRFSNILGKPNFKGEFESPLSLCNNNNVVRFGINTTQPNNLIQFDSLYIKKDGIIIIKQRVFPSFKFTESGTYTVIGKQGTCLSEESDPVEIKIGEPITANITGSTSIYPGQKAKLNLNFTGGNAWSYQTSDVATGQTTSLSPTLKNVSPSSTQTYSITSVASNCGVGTITGNATVTVLPCPTGQTVSVDSGNWNTSSTWACGQMPSATLDTIIQQGHTVNLPNGYQGNAKKLELKGGLIQGIGASLRVNN
jgi:hypothetical protein